MICNICTNEYNDKKRVKITCNICKQDCCRLCIEKYVLEQPVHIHCMYCRNVWDYVFIFDNMSQQCLKKIRDKQAKMLLEIEKALLPDTQKYVEYERYICTMEKQIETNLIKTNRLSSLLIGIEKEIPLKSCPNPECRTMFVFHKDKFCYKCKHQICNICRTSIEENCNHICNKERKLIYEQYQEYIKERIALFHDTEVMKQKVLKWRNSFITENEIKDCEEKILCSCPREYCKGYIMDTKYECNMCYTKICSKCFCIKTDENEQHYCNNDDIKTVSVIKKTTKPCPGCGTLIQKIDGCNQMWCTNCNTAFGWISGKIETGAVHNPHYFEWFNKLDRAVHENTVNNADCDGVPEQRYFMTHVSIVAKRNDGYTYNKLITCFRLLLHVNELIENEEDETDAVKRNLDLRIQWIYNKIDDKKWSSLLFQRYKKSEISKIKNDVFKMFISGSSDICHKILSCNDHANMRNYVYEWDNLIKHTNVHFSKLKDIFNLHMPYINIEDEYNFVVKMKYKYYKPHELLM